MSDSDGQIRIILSLDGKQYTADLSAAVKATEAVGKTTAKAGAEGAEGMNVLGGATARAKTEMLVLLHELSQGRVRQFGGSLLVMAEYLGLSGGLFSAAGLAAAGLFGIIAGGTYEIIKGAKEANAFNDVIRLTGGFAGLTSGQFQNLVHQIDDGKGHLQATRDVLQALVASGRFTSESIGSVAHAVLNFSQASGEAAPKVVEKFLSMSDGAADFAAKFNSSYHFLTLAQFQHIELLEKEGHTQEAIRATTDALNDSLEKQKQPLGDLEKLWNALGLGISRVGDYLRSIGRNDLNDQIEAQKEYIAQAEAGLKVGGAPLDLSSAQGQAALAYIQHLHDQLSLLVQQQQVKEKIAADESKQRQEDAKQIAAEQKRQEEAEAAAKRAAAERDRMAKQDLRNELDKEESERNAIQKVQVETAELAEQLRLGRDLTSSEKALVDLRTQRNLVTGTSLEKALEEKQVLEDQVRLEKERTQVIQARIDASRHQEEAIERDRVSGRISYFEAQRRLDQSRQDDQSFYESQLARGGLKPEETQRVLDALQKIREAREPVSDLSRMIADLDNNVLASFGDSAANAFGELIRGSKSAGEAWKDFTGSLLDDMAKIIAKMIELALIQAALRPFGYTLSGGAITAIGGGGAAGAGGTPGLSPGFTSAAGGGYIRGPGTSTSDSIPARLSNGEYVLKASAVRRIGRGTLDGMNFGRTRRFADGGYVGDSGNVVVQIVNNGQPVKEDSRETSTTPDGRRLIKIMVSQAMAEDVNNNGAGSRAFAQRFGLAARPVSR